RHDALPISTVCMRMAASAAAVILAGGAPGKRYALPHARVMLHQPHGGAQGQATDIEIQARLIVQMREQLNQILAEHTGQPVEKVATDTERDYWMLADEAKERKSAGEGKSGGSGRRHTRFSRDWSSDVCSSDLARPRHVAPASWRGPGPGHRHRDPGPAHRADA